MCAVRIKSGFQLHSAASHSCQRKVLKYRIHVSQEFFFLQIQFLLKRLRFTSYRALHAPGKRVSMIIYNFASQCVCIIAWCLSPVMNLFDLLFINVYPLQWFLSWWQVFPSALFTLFFFFIFGKNCKLSNVCPFEFFCFYKKCLSKQMES